MELRRVVGVLCTTFLIASLVVQWIVAWLLQITFRVVAYPFTTREQRQDVCGYIFRYANFVGMDLVNPFWRVRVRNAFPRTDAHKVIVMMNHSSAADPFVAIRSMLPRDGSWVCKSGLFRVPFGGWCMANAGDLAVHFRNKTTGFDLVKGTVTPMMREACAKLRRGRMLCIFPEGVRNADPTGPLNPFRLGFFYTALQENAVIVPLALSGTEDLWPLGSALLYPGTAYFTFGEPIEPHRFSSAEELAAHVWRVISDLRDTHPDRVALRKKQAQQPTHHHHHHHDHSHHHHHQHPQGSNGNANASNGNGSSSNGSSNGSDAAHCVASNGKSKDN